MNKMTEQYLVLELLGSSSIVQFIVAILLEAHMVHVDTDIHTWPSDLSLLTTCLIGVKVWLLLSNADISCSETSISKLCSSLVTQFQNYVRNFEIGTQFGNWQNANYQKAQNIII